MRPKNKDPRQHKKKQQHNKILKNKNYKKLCGDKIEQQTVTIAKFFSFLAAQCTTKQIGSFHTPLFTYPFLSSL